MDKKPKKKIIVILGPTASGKSNLGVVLAREIGGEVISADSRQVYKGLDIGTGKVARDKIIRNAKSYKLKAKSYYHRGIPHHLLDVVSLRQLTLHGAQGFTAAQFKILAEKKIEEIAQRKKVPIVVGGTGFYIDTLLGAVALPHVPPNQKLRAALNKKSTEDLFTQLKKLDPRRTKTMDKKNKVRLVRAIEIARALGKVPALKKPGQKYAVLKIGLAPDDKALKDNIRVRLLARIKKGMIGEAKKLHRQGLSWKRMEELGLEYRYLSKFLQGKITKKEMTEKLKTEIWRYAKRQRRWFKRDTDIKWFTPSAVEGFSPTERKKIKKEITKFLTV